MLTQSLLNTSAIQASYIKHYTKWTMNKMQVCQIYTFPTATTSSTTVSAIIIIAVASVVWRGETKSNEITNQWSVAPSITHTVLNLPMTLFSRLHNKKMCVYTHTYVHTTCIFCLHSQIRNAKGPNSTTWKIHVKWYIILISTYKYQYISQSVIYHCALQLDTPPPPPGDYCRSN